MFFDARLSLRRTLSDAPALRKKPRRLPLLLAVAACSAQKAARRCALSGGRFNRPPPAAAAARRGNVRAGGGGGGGRFLFVCALLAPSLVASFRGWGWSVASGFLAASVGRGAAWVGLLLSGVSAMVALFPVVAGSCVGSGASRWFVRSSARSLSGFVLVASFASASAARLFAARWAVRLPVACRGCAVRRSGSLWAVSVPVSSVPAALVAAAS